MSRSRIVAACFLALIVGLSCGGGEGGGGDSPTAPPGGSGGNHAPTVNLNTDRTSFTYGQTANLSAVTTDADGDQVTLSWSAKRGAVATSGPTATTATYTAPASWGPDSAIVAASDGRGGQGRAVAALYVRNPDPPEFAFGAVGSASCGVGTPIPDGLILTLSPEENVRITSITMKPRQCSSNCVKRVDYSPALNLTAGSVFTWTAGGCFSQACCQFYSCGNCAYWTITIRGERPAPDGGTFVFTCSSWRGPGDDCF